MKKITPLLCGDRVSEFSPHSLWWYRISDSNFTMYSIIDA